MILHRPLEMYLLKDLREILASTNTSEYQKAWIKKFIPGKKCRGCVSDYLAMTTTAVFSSSPHEQSYVARKCLLVCSPAAASWPCLLKLMNLWDTEASKPFLKSCISSQDKVNWKAAAHVSKALGLPLPMLQSHPVVKIALKVTDKDICDVYLLNALPLKLLSEIISRYSSMLWCTQNCSKLIQCSPQALHTRWLSLCLCSFHCHQAKTRNMPEERLFI